MKVLNLLIFLLIFFKVPVFAQIVTPSLDPSVLSLMPATAGWRDKTNFNGSLETFSETDFDSNESKISNVSYMVSSRLVNNIYQESFLQPVMLIKNTQTFLQILMKNQK